MWVFKRELLFVMIVGLGWGVSRPSASAQMAAFQWRIEQIDQGTKPALALDGDGNPTIVYMLERVEGWVRAATWNGSDWQVAAVDQGYFYGPPDIVIDHNDVPHITYHDHQDTVFDPQKGDLVYAFSQNGRWTINTLVHPGHDGWDSRITVDADNRVRISAIDPVEFSGKGVEYYAVDQDGKFFVETIGSGPLTYMYATAIAIGPTGEPAITYYDQKQSSLRLATRLGSDNWQIETVDDAGETGLFSSMIIDKDGGTHISYFEKTGVAPGFYTVGNVKYAFRPSGASDWEITQIDTLDKVVTGFADARNITDLALDSLGNPWIAYSDEQSLRLAVFDGAQWRVQTVTTAQTNRLAQIVSLALDAKDVPHIAFATVTGKTPLDGFVMQASPVRPGS